MTTNNTTEKKFFEAEELSNTELINLSEYLLKFLSEPGTYAAYHMQERQELENATSELLKRAGIGLNKDLDACELSDFSRLIEKAASALKHNKHNATEKSFFDAMESLGESVDSPVALSTLLWETWTIGLAKGSEQIKERDTEAREFFVRYMAARGTEIDKSAPLALMYSAFMAGIGLALDVFMPTDTDNEGNNDERINQN